MRRSAAFILKIIACKEGTCQYIKATKARRETTACLETFLPVAPGVPGKQNQNGEDLQSACQHGPTQHQLAQIAVSAEITGGANGLHSGADIIKGTQHSGEIGADGEAVQRNNGKDYKGSQQPARS